MPAHTEAKPVDAAMRDAFPVPAPGFHIIAEQSTLKHFHAAWRWKALSQKLMSIQSVLSMLYYVAIFSMIGWLAAQYLDYRHPVRATLAPISTEVRAGSDLKVKFTDVYRYRVCDLTMSWVFWDGRNEVHPFSDAVIPGTGEPGKIDDFSRGFWVGDWSPGPARLRISRSYSCPDNYVHEIKWAEPEIRFTILPK